MTWQGLTAIALALAAVVWCGHDAFCRENLPFIGAMAMSIVTGVFSLAKGDQQRRRKHRSSDIPPDSGSYPRGGTIPPAQRKDSAA